MCTKKPELTNDTEQARRLLEPEILRLRGLFQLWNIFAAAEALAAAYVRDSEQLKWEAKLAFTKALVIEYAKPWSTRNGAPLRSLLNPKKKIAFLELITSATGTHNALMELRNRMVAHIDQYFESVGVTIRGIYVPNPAQNPDTLDSVFVPVAPRMESSRGMWWIQDVGKWQEMTEHISACKNATHQELATVARALRDECLNHMHVLASLNDLVSLEQIEPKSGSDGKPDYDVQSARDLVPNVNLGRPQQTKLGDQHIQSLVAIFEPDPALPSEIDVEGRGYRLTLPEPDENGKARWTVTFPKYPYPAEKPNT